MRTQEPPFVLIDNDGDEDQKYLKILIHGIHGSGKTYLAGTAANCSEMSDVLMLSAEGGDMTLKNNPHEDFDKITKVQARSFARIAAFQKFVISHCKLRDLGNESSLEKLRQNEEWLRLNKKVEVAKLFKTVIIDSLAEVDSIHRNKLVGIEDSTDLETDPQDSSWSIYNQNLSRITRFCKQLRDLPINVIFTTPSIQDRSGKWRPKLVGQLATDVQGVVDIVGFLEMGRLDEETGDIARRLWVMPSTSHDAKCRGSHNRRPYLMNPDMKAIMLAVGLIK